MTKVKTSITLSPETHARLTQQAAREHRTISNMVERVIEKIFGTAKPAEVLADRQQPEPATTEGK